MPVGLLAGPELVEVADELAAAVLGATALTSEGLRVPQITHASEPGLAARHCWKVA